MKLVYIVLLFTLIAGTGVSSSVGTVPGTINLGEVDRGETVERTVYVRAFNIDEQFTIDPSVSSEPKSDLFSNDNPLRFDVSEQDFDQWITIEDVTIDPTTEKVVQLSDGSSAKVNGEFTFELNVPQGTERAEPGYREGTVRLNPDLSPNGGGGAGARVIGETKMKFSFDVPGNANRQIAVQNVRASRTGESSADIGVLLRNTGTVTVSTEGFKMDVLKDGVKVGEIEATSTTLAPGESKNVEGYWSEDSPLEEGVYRVDGSVNYMTGAATASGSFSLPGITVVEEPIDEPENPGGGGDGSSGGDSLPVWLVVMVLALLGVLMWGFDIEPFWILVIIGFLGISAFILMSGLPNLLLLVLLIMVGIFVYGGM